MPAYAINDMVVTDPVLFEERRPNVCARCQQSPIC